MTLFLIVLAGALISAASISQPDSAAQGPLAQLSDHLEAAMSRAHITDAQKAQLQADDSTLRTNIRLNSSGSDVDRSEVAKAVKDIRSVAHSGAFLPEDRRTLEADIKALRKR